jgi:hypothetical protein
MICTSVLRVRRPIHSGQKCAADQRQGQEEDLMDWNVHSVYTLLTLIIHMPSSLKGASVQKYSTVFPGLETSLN